MLGVQAQDGPNVQNARSGVESDQELTDVNCSQPTGEGEWNDDIEDEVYFQAH